MEKENAFIKGLNNNVNKNKEIIDLSFLSSNRIQVLEEGIQKSLKTVAKTQLSVCIALYRIGSENLFAEYGYNSFNEYVIKQALLPRSTAVEYYYMGKYWLEMQEDLKQIGFTEDDGITKLKMIPKEMTTEEKKKVLEHLKNDSVRQFKQFISNLRLKKDTIERSSISKNNKKPIDNETVSIIIDQFIHYYKTRNRSANTNMTASLKGAQTFIEYLVDLDIIDKKHYNYMIDQIK